MLKSFLRAGLLVSLFLGSGCSALPGFIPGFGTASTIDNSFWQSNMPTYKVGMAWTYNTDVQVTGLPDVTSTYTREVTEADASGTKVKTTIAGVSSTEDLTPQTMMSFGGLSGAPDLSVQTSDSIVSAGNEDVTVPAGTYKGATKLNVSASSVGAGSNVTVWVAKGVGIVKELVTTGTAAASTSVTTELASFTGS